MSSLVLTSAHSIMSWWEKSIHFTCNIRTNEPFINFILCNNGIFAPRAAGRIIKLD